MAVYVNNISINSGENFYRDFYLDDVNGNSIDLTGYTGKSEVRKHPEECWCCHNIFTYICR